MLVVWLLAVQSFLVWLYREYSLRHLYGPGRGVYATPLFHTLKWLVTIVFLPVAFVEADVAGDERPRFQWSRHWLLTVIAFLFPIHVFSGIALVFSGPPELVDRFAALAVLLWLPFPVYILRFDGVARLREFHRANADEAERISHWFLGLGTGLAGVAVLIGFGVSVLILPALVVAVGTLLVLLLWLMRAEHQVELEDAESGTAGRAGLSAAHLIPLVQLIAVPWTITRLIRRLGEGWLQIAATWLSWAAFVAGSTALWVVGWRDPYGLWWFLATGAWVVGLASMAALLGEVTRVLRRRALDRELPSQEA